MSEVNERIRTLQRKYGILGNSAPVEDMLETVDQVAPTDISVLITGESGSGKELIASALHGHSRRAHKSLVIVNCGAIPAGIIESELFGHKKGSFTGASDDRKGYFQTADGGTIFLDEIGETPLETQVKLLRVLEQGEFLPVGASKSVKVDVRVIAASNRNLGDEVESGNFRKDLYYRLKAVTISVPPLRNRRIDIPILAEKFARECAIRNQIVFKGFSDGAFKVMQDYNWPGNIRELKNFVESIVVLEKGGVLRTETVLHYLRVDSEQGDAENPFLPVPMNRTVDQAERELILQQLFLLRQDIREMKGLMSSGGWSPETPEKPSKRYPTELEIVQHYNEADEAGEGEEPTIYNPKTIGNVTSAEAERELIYKTLEKFNFNKRKTAVALEMAERTLYRKINEYGIPSKKTRA
ncbi:MAG: sigma-54-dependent Fis family transcriptional regulator [Candidatus Marinimicrobia bacterium CG_4_10_14_0_2_um_filter_48_9]|nr:MAG: sigma-54-dependent Fis family transcriptional regulator [Candidatus Marinimicrobia bacterium CG_4_10_14_0_2_um_filter_48_9]